MRRSNSTEIPQSQACTHRPELLTLKWNTAPFCKLVPRSPSSAPLPLQRMCSVLCLIMDLGTAGRSLLQDFKLKLSGKAAQRLEADGRRPHALRWFSGSVKRCQALGCWKVGQCSITCRQGTSVRHAAHKSTRASDDASGVGLPQAN